MKDLVGVSSSFPVQRSLETGDDLNEANLEEVAQSSANRAEYLKVKVDDLIATGAKKVRVASNSANLKALTGMTASEACYVFGEGLFFFRSSVLLGSDISRRGYNADNNSGHWWQQASNVILYEGSSASVSPSNSDVVASGSWQDLTDALETAVLSLDVNDKFRASAHFNLAITPAASNSIDVRLALERIDSPSTTGIDESERKVQIVDSTDPNPTWVIPVSLFGRRSITTAGTYKIKVQVKCASVGQTIRATLGRQIEHLVIRP